MNRFPDEMEAWCTCDEDDQPEHPFHKHVKGNLKFNSGNPVHICAICSIIIYDWGDE